MSEDSDQENIKEAIAAIALNVTKIHEALHIGAKMGVTEDEKTRNIYLASLLVFAGVEFARTGADISDEGLIQAFRNAQADGQRAKEAMRASKEKEKDNWTNLNIGYG